MPNLQNIDLKAIARTAMRKYKFETDFPKAVMSQVNALDSSTPEKAKKSVKDMRNFLWSSIDNIDTMDLDQIEYCEQGKNNEILVKVAIADVDAYVKKGSETDLHASKNATSVYTGIEVFPMLPNHLSTELSSLPVGEDRLAIVVEFVVKSDGSVRSVGIHRALVKNKAKLVYESVGEWLEGKGKIPETIENTKGLEAQIRLQHNASMRLREYRLRQGALELETLETKAVIKDGKVIEFVVVRANPARYIIENFMIAANGVVSRFLEDASIPTIQRIVRTPKNWEEIVILAKTRGTMLPEDPDAKALSQFLAKERSANPELFPDLSLTIVKLLGPGEYEMHDQGEQTGHFCLAVTSYTHATAPNRRYVDLVVQRQLKAALEKTGRQYTKNELSQLAEWSTDRQKGSKKVERFMVKAEASSLLAKKIGQIFDALVTGSSPKGVYVRLVDPPVEGKVMRGAQGLRVGQKIKVKLTYLNPEKGYIDFERA